MCRRQEGLDPLWRRSGDGVKIVLGRVLEPVLEEPLLGGRWGQERALVVYSTHLDRFLGLLLSFPLLALYNSSGCRCLSVKELGQFLSDNDADTGAGFVAGEFVDVVVGCDHDGEEGGNDAGLRWWRKDGRVSRGS